jgi:hypothetical protein
MARHDDTWGATLIIKNQHQMMVSGHEAPAALPQGETPGKH